MTALAGLLDGLGAATQEAERAEQSFRADFARRVALLAEERAFAFRRLNLVRAVAETAGRAADEETAGAYGIAHLRNRLGWDETEGVRNEILQRFVPVAQALHNAGRETGETPDGEEPPRDPAAALAEFESWYRDRVGSSFWVLFENPMRETPLVDF